MANAPAVQDSIESEATVFLAQPTPSGMEHTANAQTVIHLNGVSESPTPASRMDHAVVKVDMFQLMEFALLHLETYDYG
jgi:hypothetical protein